MKRRLSLASAAAAAPDGAVAHASEQQQEVPPMKGVAVVRPEEYESQLEAKVQRVRQLFVGFDLPPVEVHRSAPIHYRQRAEFRVWHEGGSCHYVMFGMPEGASQPRRYRVDSFPVGSEAINVSMQEVMTACAASERLRRKLYQVNIHTTLSGDVMVTMVYHRKLDVSWEAEAASLRARLRLALERCRGEREDGATGQQEEQQEERQQQQQQQQERERQRRGSDEGEAGGLEGRQPGVGAVHVIGRSHKQKVLVDEEFVTERLKVNGREIEYRQVEGAFSQPNSGIAAQMLAWAEDVTRGSEGHDLLELYCGNGNFTVALAPCFRQVIATEVSKASVEAARHNLAASGAPNVFIARMAAHEFTQAWAGKERRNRLNGMTPWDELDLGTLLVDPPRAGLDDESRPLLGSFRNVIYISCNPKTLARDLATVSGTHCVARFAVFDQFPYTPHVECGAYLVQR